MGSRSFFPRLSPLAGRGRRDAPAGCAYTIQNGRSGTLIEISFLIGETYLAIRIAKEEKNGGREEGRAGRSERWGREHGADE